MTVRLGALGASALIAVALAGVLAGCTDAPPPKPTPSATATDEAKPPAVTDITDPAGTGEGWVGALDDTTVTACEASDGGWHVAGTATNSSETASNYRIYVSVFDTDDTLRALKQVDVDGVSPAATVDWQGDVAAEGDDLYCVLRVERYVAG